MWQKAKKTLRAARRKKVVFCRDDYISIYFGRSPSSNLSGPSKNTKRKKTNRDETQMFFPALRHHKEEIRFNLLRRRRRKHRFSSAFIPRKRQQYLEIENRDEIISPSRSRGSKTSDANVFPRLFGDPLPHRAPQLREIKGN